MKSCIKQDRTKWHQWFAWHPVWIPTTGDGGRWVWLETMERRITYVRSILGSYPRPYYKLKIGNEKQEAK
jgi:hypothetical protein